MDKILTILFQVVKFFPHGQHLRAAGQFCLEPVWQHHILLALQPCSFSPQVEDPLLALTRHRWRILASCRVAPLSYTTTAVQLSKRK